MPESILINETVDQSLAEFYNKIATFSTLASVVIVIAMLLVAIFVIAYRKIAGKTYRKTSDMGLGLLFYSALLLLSIFFLRFAVGCYQIGIKANSLGVWEELFNSAVHALQTFSMDEDYTQYLNDGKVMIEKLFGVEFQTAFGIYSSLQNFAAPIAGGAIIYQIITNIYPALRLKLTFFKPFYYFSELNERSITLAESLLQQKHGFFSKPLVIFASTDDSKEENDELVSRAKLMGAICLKADISEIRSFSFRSAQYFLMDEDTMDNIRALAALSNEQNFDHLKNAKVYIFCQNDSYVLTEHGTVPNEYKFP